MESVVDGSAGEVLFHRQLHGVAVVIGLSEPLWSGTDSGAFNLSFAVLPGDTLDFCVGVITTFASGSTPLVMSISGTVPQGAETLVTVSGCSGPWEWAPDGLNTNYQYGIVAGTTQPAPTFASMAPPPTVIKTGSGNGLNFTPGNKLTFQYVGGRWSYSTFNLASYPLVGPNGDSGKPTTPIQNLATYNEVTFAIDPLAYIPVSSGILYSESLVGTFADSSGTIVGTPGVIPCQYDSVSLINPSGATQFQMGMSDGWNLDNSGSLAIKVTETETYAGWAYRLWGPNAPANQAAETATPANDGIANLLKYALEMDPKVAYSGNSVGMPTMGTTTANSDKCLTLTFNGTALDVSYTVQATHDFFLWTPLQTWPAGSPPGLVTVSDTIPIASLPRRFMRLSICDLYGWHVVGNHRCGSLWCEFG